MKSQDIFSRIKKGKLPKILVLNGGGVKGLAQIGALEYLEENKYLSEIETIAGTSVGSLIGLGLVLGYTAKEIHFLAENLKINNLHTNNYQELFAHFGLDLGKKLDVFLKKIIERKTNRAEITLKELYVWKKIKFIMTASVLNEGKVIYLSHETFPDLPIHLAVRMSCAIPVVFCPVEYQEKSYVDGGCTDDYPIALFKNQIHDVLGIHLRNIYQAKIKTFEDVIIGYMYCILNASNKESDLFKDNTIEIEISTSSINLDISLEIKKNLIQKGYEVAKKYFE